MDNNNKFLLRFLIFLLLILTCINLYLYMYILFQMEVINVTQVEIVRLQQSHLEHEQVHLEQLQPLIRHQTAQMAMMILPWVVTAFTIYVFVRVVVME